MGCSGLLHTLFMIETRYRRLFGVVHARETEGGGQRGLLRNEGHVGCSKETRLSSQAPSAGSQVPIVFSTSNPWVSKLDPDPTHEKPYP